MKKDDDDFDDADDFDDFIEASWGFDDYDGDGKITVNDAVWHQRVVEEKKEADKRWYEEEDEDDEDDEDDEERDESDEEDDEDFLLSAP